MRNLIIDGSNLLHRSYHASKNRVELNSEGRNISHISAFLSMFKFIVSENRSDRIIIAWDGDGRFKNYRMEGVEYKAHRNRDDYEVIHENDELLKTMICYLGAHNITSNKMEADDVISWLCLSKYPDDNNIVASSDKDFLQLVGFGKSVIIYSPIKREFITESNFERVLNLEPKHFLPYKALIGDSSDNIGGVYGYGEVKTRKFVKDLKHNFNKLKEDEKKIFIRNIKLMDLRTGFKYYPDEIQFYEKQMRDDITINLDDFFNICENLELGEVLKWKGSYQRVFKPINRPVELNLDDLLINN